MAFSRMTRTKKDLFERSSLFFRIRCCRGERCNAPKKLQKKLLRLKAQSNVTDLRAKIFFNKFYSENEIEDEEDTTRMWNGSQLKSSQEEIMIGADDKRAETTADIRKAVLVKSSTKNDLAHFGRRKSEQKDCECSNVGHILRFEFSVQKIVIFICLSLQYLLITSTV